MKHLTYLFTTALALSFSSPSWSQPYRTALDIRVPNPPTLVNIDNKPTAYYELYVTNFSTDTILLTALTILDTKDNQIYFTSQDTDLAKRVNPYIAPHVTAIIYLEYSTPKGSTDVIHQLSFSYKDPTDTREYTIRGASTTLQTQRPPIVLGNPLRGGPWCAVYNPSWTTGHRKKIFTIDGKARIPGRFAIDFMKLNEKGQYAIGNEDSIANWPGYNADVLAVADGIIAAATDTFSQSPTLSSHPKYSSDKATGNYISLKIGENRFVFYEHLEPGSITVKAGETVKKGQRIARLGFTGQSTGPHLHLHVADTNSPLGAEGIPFAFEHFDYLGIYNKTEDFGQKPWDKPTNPSDTSRKNEHPAPFAVIAFSSPRPML